MHSFERAGLQREMDIAIAYHLRERARLMQPGSRHANAERAQAFAFAADAFLKCADAGGDDVQTYYRVAGDCYSHANDAKHAAQAYLSATEYTLAAQHYRKGGLFDEAVDVVQAHHDNVEPEFAHTLIDTARVFYLREQVSSKYLSHSAVTILTCSQNFE